MKRKHLNLIILVLFQAMVFLTPIAVKAFHHHLSHSVRCLNTHTAYQQAEQYCPICNFEFTDLSKASIDTPTYPQPINNPLIHESIQSGFGDSCFVLSLRAPPLA